MKYDRVEVRLDEEYQHKLSDLTATYGTSVSDVVRRGLDALYDESVEKRRREALELILGFEGIEDMPEPEELRRQILASYDEQYSDTD